jgi:hypothetical protein
MDLSGILSIAFATLITLVVAHIAVFYVIRTLYPPSQPQPKPIHIQPPQETVSNVVVPTYEAPVPVEAPREEEQRKGPPPPVATSIKRESGVDSTDTQPRE